MDHVFQTPQALAAGLSEALDRHELVTYFQPQVDIGTGRVVAVEALVRWVHAVFGVIPPDEFIPIAESAGTIHEVGKTVAADAISQIAEWKSRGIDLEISVNVSPTELGPTLAAELETLLALHDVEPLLLTAEITESEPILDLPRATSCLRELRELGIGVSVDDFGVGYASVGQLRSLPATELKVDQSLIRGSRAVARKTLEPVLAEASESGIRIVAEGVETEDHLAHARELGCDRAQGYLIGEPMTAIELEARYF